MGAPGARLLATAAATVVVAVAEVAHTLGRDDLVPAMRGFLVAVVLFQVPLAGLVLRHSPTGAAGLLLAHVSTLAAVVGGGIGGSARPVAGAGALLALVALVSSLHTFPTPELPTSTREAPR